MPSLSEQKATTALAYEPAAASSTKFLHAPDKPVIIGIYGLPGSGKSYCLHHLKMRLDHNLFSFYEGSEMIAEIVPGGLVAFQSMDDQKKQHYRQLGIQAIKAAAMENGKTAIVAGHFMFWAEDMPLGQPVYTEDDFSTYTHILYLNLPAETISRHRLDDRIRDRPNVSVSHIQKWLQTEEKALRRLCREHKILFMLLSQDVSTSKLTAMIQDFRTDNEGHNNLQAKQKLDEVLAARQGLETMLVMDADRTLTKDDSGEMFWNLALRSVNEESRESPLKTIFKSTLSYSYHAFRQVTLLYAEAFNDEQFESLCQNVASSIAMYPEFVSLLHLVIKETPHVGAIVMTCGLQRIWEIVLEREGLSEKVQVIGGGRDTCGLAVTPDTKKSLVVHLKNRYNVNVWAFGDSPLDIAMLQAADHAIVIVGDEEARSRSMEVVLGRAVDQGLRAHQVVFPSHALPRLDTKRLPLTRLTRSEFVDDILSRRDPLPGLDILHASSSNSVRLLMTPMRDATVAGPSLREAHRHVGAYLARAFVSEIIGVERYQIKHVQGHFIDGYRLFHEQQTLIVALMRAGEPMALGVNDAFPHAMFLHAKTPDEIKAHHVNDQVNVILVDSVVNTGKTILQFVQHIRKLHGTIRIVVVAGVVQCQCISKGCLAQAVTGHAKLSIVTLRLSDNKYTGSGTTDTGNRLFNTLHLE